MAVRDYKPHYAIDAIGLCVQTAMAKKILAKFNVKFVVPKAGHLPTPGLLMRIRKLFAGKPSKGQESEQDLSSSQNCENKKLELYKTDGLSICKLVGKLNQFLAIRKNVFAADIALLAGNKSLDFFTKKASQIIWIGSHDFHHFNKANLDLKANRKLCINESFVLFVDDCLPSANDWKLLDLEPPVTADGYYPALRSFFQRIESLYDCRVIIAGHPNSESDDSYASNMGGRTVRFGETASLVLQSSLILVHGSSAVSFAVLARKPAMFLTTQELDQSYYGVNVRTMADILGSPLVYMDDPDSYIPGLSSAVVNAKKYKCYEVNYLRSERSNETAPWQAFISYVNGAKKNG